VATGVTRVGTSSFGLAQAAFQDGACIAVADCVMVKAANGLQAPLAEAERELLAGLAFAGDESR
jgi:acyl-CoA thioester hydrolase